MDLRRPSAVSLLLARRGSSSAVFTVNAFALDETGEIIDLFHGLGLENQVLQRVGVASRRFNEDTLQVCVVSVFQASLGLNLSQKLLRR